MDPADLKSLPLFESLTKDELERAARWADEIEVEAGKHLAEQGAFAHEFFVIREGEAEVLVDGEHRADLGPGDFFGEIALLETERRTASVVAKTPMRLVIMFGRDFKEMADEMPDVCERIRNAIRQRRPDS